MEKKINNSVGEHFREFKDKFKDLLMSEQFSVLSNEQKSSLLGFVYDYNAYEVKKEMLEKRKRVKNVVPLFNRCCAKRADDRQCTRRRKPDELYCGTHSKSRPHGTVDDVEQEKKDSKVKHQVWAQDIKGIIYYIDKNQNVYDPEDILKSKVNPKIIAKWKHDHEGNVYIPQYAK